MQLNGDLLAKEAGEGFFDFGVVLKFGFYHGAHGHNAVGKGLVVHMVYHGDGLFQHGADVVGDVVAQIG